MGRHGKVWGSSNRLNLPITPQFTSPEDPCNFVFHKRRITLCCQNFVTSFYFRPSHLSSRCPQPNNHEKPLSSKQHSTKVFENVYSLLKSHPLDFTLKTSFHHFLLVFSQNLSPCTPLSSLCALQLSPNLICKASPSSWQK